MFRPLHKLKGFSIANGRCYCDFANSSNQNNFELKADKKECENPETWAGKLSLDECQKKCKDTKIVNILIGNGGSNYCSTKNGVKRCSCYLTNHDCSNPQNSSNYQIYGKAKGLCQKHSTYRRYDFTEEEIDGFYKDWFRVRGCSSGYENICTDADEFNKEKCCKSKVGSSYTEADKQAEITKKNNEAKRKGDLNDNMKESECKEKINPFTETNYSSCEDMSSKETNCRNQSVNGVNFNNCLEKKQYEDNKNNVNKIKQNRINKNENRCKQVNNPYQNGNYTSCEQMGQKESICQKELNPNTNLNFNSCQRKKIMKIILIVVEYY